MALSILILTDGKMGDLAQCRGVAHALTAVENITEHVVEPGWVTALPFPNMPLSAVDRQLSIFSRQWDMVIASGRRTVPYLRAFKRLANRKAFTVYLKDPVYNRADIDVVWVPDHDALAGNNVFSTATAPHAVSQSILAEAKKSAETRFVNYPSPSVGLILGGNSKSVTWDKATADRFANGLANLPANSNVLVTPSRRTPEVLLEAVSKALATHTHWIWDGDSDNPYVEILAHCDRLILTGDSHNMVSEALAAAKPVHVFRPPGLSAKLTSFLTGLEGNGLIEDLSAGFARSSSVAVDATGEIAAEIQRRHKNWHEQ